MYENDRKRAERRGPDGSDTHVEQKVSGSDHGSSEKIQ
jgi:hypothetical protein